LQQNAIGCATNHHGHDCELNGLPGWLADTKKDIDAAEDAILAMQAERRGDVILPGTDDMEKRYGWLAGKLADMGYNVAHVQPAPIAGLEPVAWRYWWRSKYLTYSLNEPRPDDAEPLYTRAQLEAHAAEQVRAEREVCLALALENDDPVLIADAIRARGQV